MYIIPIVCYCFVCIKRRKIGGEPINAADDTLENIKWWRSMRYSLIDFLTILGSIGIRKSTKTPSALVVDPAMASRALLVGATASFSCTDNQFIPLKS